MCHHTRGRWVSLVWGGGGGVPLWEIFVYVMWLRCKLVLSFYIVFLSTWHVYYSYNIYFSMRHQFYFSRSIRPTRAIINGAARHKLSTLIRTRMNKHHTIKVKAFTVEKLKSWNSDPFTPGVMPINTINQNWKYIFPISLVAKQLSL